MYFTKMHGTGNDFIVIEDFEGKIKDYGKAAKVLCDRHYGIGADGILVVAKSLNSDAKMMIYNSDGSFAEMCGNGIRCFAKYIYDSGIAKKDTVLVETTDGIKYIDLVKEYGKVTAAKVNMGMPKFDTKSIPAIFNAKEIISEKITIGQDEFIITSLNMGVPHTILFIDDINSIDPKALGPKIEKSSYFPQGTNVNFVEVLNDSEFSVKTWERGAGLTLACGTGACASLVACVLNGKTRRSAKAHLLGGDLYIEWVDDKDVYMTGPCETVFTGEYKKDL